VQKYLQKALKDIFYIKYFELFFSDFPINGYPFLIMHIPSEDQGIKHIITFLKKKFD